MAALVAPWILVCATPPASGQHGRPDDSLSGPVAADGAAAHSRAAVERAEPWPLRPDPTPDVEGSHCPPGAHYVFRIGGLALRLGPSVSWDATPAEPRWPTWASDLPRCGDGRTIPVRRLHLLLGSLTSLPRGCWAAGVPPGPDGPACAATPGGLRAGRRYFALGLPSEIGLYEQAALATIFGEDARLRGRTVGRRTPLGNEAFIEPLPGGEPLGRVTYRLPRIGEKADALGPLLVQCDTARWPDPTPPERSPRPHTCVVSFHLADAGVRVTYRFPREVFDEPDWQALDLRVRRWIEARATPTPRP